MLLENANYGHNRIECFSDVDWLDLKFTSYCVFVVGNLVSWKSKRQSIVSRSSAEAEYRAMAQGTCEITWIYQLLNEVGLMTSVSAKLRCDNQDAIHIASNHIFHELTKHLRLNAILFMRKYIKG